MAETLNEAAQDYARGMAKFLGVPTRDMEPLAERYKRGMREFAQKVESQASPTHHVVSVKR